MCAVIFRNGCVQKLQESNTLSSPRLPQPEYRSLELCLGDQTWDLCSGLITEWLLRQRPLSHLPSLQRQQPRAQIQVLVQKHTTLRLLLPASSYRQDRHTASESLEASV